MRDSPEPASKIHMPGWTRVLQWLLVLCGVAMLGWSAGRRSTPPAGAPARALPAAIHGRLGVLVLFQPKDCGSYSNYLQALATLSISDSLPVIGVPIHAGSDPGELSTAFPGLDPPFPLRPRLAGSLAALLAGMGYHRTPLAVLIDPYGRPLMVIPPHSVPFQQAELTRAVQTYVRTIRASGMLP